MSQFPPTQAGAAPGDMSLPLSFTPEESLYIQSQLRKKLGPENVSTRKGPGNTSLSYIEGWRVISIANQIFGFNGWRSSIQNFSIDFMDVNNNGAVSIGASCLVRITLRDGTYKEDIGYGMIENSKSKGQAFEKVKKEAVTDGIKRAMRQFGNALGNCVYDKDFLKNVKQVRMEPKEKMSGEFLYRGSDLEQAQSSLMTTPNKGSSAGGGVVVPGSHARIVGQESSSSSSTAAAAAAAAANGSDNHGMDNDYVDMDEMVDDEIFTMMDSLDMERPILPESPSFTFARPPTPQNLNQQQQQHQQHQQQTPSRNPLVSHSNSAPSSGPMSISGGSGSRPNRSGMSESTGQANAANAASSRRLQFPPPHTGLGMSASSNLANSTPTREPSQWPRSFADTAGFTPATQLAESRGIRRPSSDSAPSSQILQSDSPKKRHI
ncbi:hypothetical protein GQ54DRAFT_145647 [Martensiomyces pterosporus]|nr:hypothetical protein GQ54DRAFT_145647 [Martensiomyces pterosporus]